MTLEKARAWRVSRNNSGTHTFLHVSILSLLVTLQLHSLLHFVKASLHRWWSSQRMFLQMNAWSRRYIIRSLVLSTKWNSPTTSFLVIKFGWSGTKMKILLLLEYLLLKHPSAPKCPPPSFQARQSLLLGKHIVKGKRAKSPPWIGHSFPTCDRYFSTEEFSLGG